MEIDIEWIQSHTIKQKVVTQIDIEWIYFSCCLAKSQNNYMFIILLKKHYLIVK